MPDEISLRPYQEECLDAILAGLQQGYRRLGVSLATGSGKTVIFTELIGRMEALPSDKKQTLILAHRRELVEQAANHCRRAYPSALVEIEMGNSHASGTADITAASIASITSGDRISKFDANRFKLVLVDEAHHIVAPTFMKVLHHFNLSTETCTESSPALVGVSATLSRADGIRLSDAIDHIVYHKDYVDMIEEKWLSDVRFTSVKTTADLSKVKSSKFGDFQTENLSKAINTRETNDSIFRAWAERASQRNSTLVFCVDLQHVADLTAKFRSHGVDAQFVTSYTPKDIRRSRLDEFRAGKFPVLLNCGIFTEGTDIPNIDCVLLARPTKSRNLLIQMIGRGMRLHASKKDCHVLDLVSSLKSGVVTTPTLFGLDPDSIVKDASVEDLRSKKEQEELEAEREEKAKNRPTVADEGSRVMRFTDYESVYDLIQETSGERHIRALSALGWVCAGQDRYILSGPDSSYLTIKQAEPSREDRYTVLVTHRIPRAQLSKTSGKSPFRQPLEIASALDLEWAVRAADEWAREKFPWNFIACDAKWRSQPASEGQLRMLNKVRPLDDPLTPASLNKGRAADMITKMKFGAKGQYDDMEAQRRRRTLAENRIKRLEDREQVRVGPVRGH